MKVAKYNDLPYSVPCDKTQGTDIFCDYNIFATLDNFIIG
jgi:hypothetical protein